MGYAVTDILAGVRRRYFSTDSTAWPDADIIALVNEVVAGQVVPWIEKAREDHFIKYNDQALITGQYNYVMPTDVSGIQLFSVHLLDSAGNVLNPPLADTELESFAQLIGTATGQPTRYAVRGNEVLLWPTPAAGQTLRLLYARRPSTLVTRAEVVAVASVSQGGSTYTIGWTDTSPATYATASDFDLVRSVAGYEVYSAGTLTGKTASSVTFSGTAPAAITVGDFLCLLRQAPVLTYIPEEVWPVVYQAVVVEMSSSKGDDGQVARAEKALERMIKAAAPILTKRVTASHRKLPGASSRGFYSWNRITRPS